MTPGQAAAAVLEAKHGRVPPPPNIRTAVVHEFSPRCTACDLQVAFVVPAYWNPSVVQLCADCCLVWCESHEDDRSWPSDGRSTPSRVEGSVA
jgi:hypothetical protein